MLETISIKAAKYFQERNKALEDQKNGLDTPIPEAPVLYVSKGSEHAPKVQDHLKLSDDPEADKRSTEAWLAKRKAEKSADKLSALLANDKRAQLALK